MNWKKKFSKGNLIYLILDEDTANRNNLNLLEITQRLARAGQVDIFQLRVLHSSDRNTVKLAKSLSKIVHKYKKMFMVNNRADIAYLAGADGIHLGEEDIPIHLARKILPNKLIGKTVHSLEELENSQKENIDYLSLGPVFRSQTKPNLKPLGLKKLKNMIKYIRFPFFVIGGINVNNLDKLKKLGRINIALCEGILSSPDPVQMAREIKETLKS